MNDARKKTAPLAKRRPHLVLHRPRCRACNAVLPAPYKRVRYSWGQVRYCRCSCGENAAIDVL